MAIFKTLRGDSSRISTETTPFHDGYAYFTKDDGGFYIDATMDDGTEKRVQVNPKSESVDVILLAAAWTNNQQTVAVARLGANQNGTISQAKNLTEEQMDAVANAKLYVVSQAEGSLVIGAHGDIPTIDIPATVILFP